MALKREVKDGLEIGAVGSSRLHLLPYTRDIVWRASNISEQAFFGGWFGCLAEGFVHSHTFFRHLWLFSLSPTTS